MDQKKANDSKKYKQYAVDEEINAATIVYNEAATQKDIKVLMDIHEPCIEKEAKNEVCDDTIETLDASEVDAESEVFGDAAETPKLEVTTLLLPIHEPSTQRKAENEVSEDTLKTR